MCITTTKSLFYFNSRPHKEVDFDNGASYISQTISTHDLTRRSTAKASGDLSNALTFQLTTSQGGRRNVYDLTFEDVDISTHDLTRRSTIDHQFLFLRQKYFNSRPHKEVDFFSVNASRPCIHISTHDLTRRSTSRQDFYFLYTLFQLTTSQGGRHCI